MISHSLVNQNKGSKTREWCVKDGGGGWRGSLKKHIHYEN